MRRQDAGRMLIPMAKNGTMSDDQKHEINYLDSFNANTNVVPTVISSLLRDLRSMRYPQDEISEIILSMDEAITNAIQETIRKKHIENNPDLKERREITIRYTITDGDFDATIIDHGRGLDLQHLVGLVPNNLSKDYHDQIVRYATDAEKKRIIVRVNGNELTLKGIGAGLKIILAFMDAVTIDLIDRERVLASNVSEFTDGTILNLKRRRRYAE